MSTPILDEMDLWNAFCNRVTDLEIFAVPYSVEGCRGRDDMQRRVDDVSAAWAEFVQAAPCEDDQ